jgi:hypothetical protein
MTIGALQVLDYASTISPGSVVPPNDFGMVASIDGCKSPSSHLRLVLLLICVSDPEADPVANCECATSNGLP